MACTGTGACAGARSCIDGSSFGPCQCGGLDGGVDAGVAPDAGDSSTASDAASDASGAHTTGNACASDAVCTGAGEKCSNDSFGADTILPSPVCVSTGCTAGAIDCNAGTGACAPTRTSGVEVCSAKCAFDATSGAAPTGCTGTDLCRYVGYAKNAQNVVSGVGACLGGCTADGDCTGGNACQLETGECVKSKRTMSKLLGETCTVGTTECFCATPNKGTSSVCTQLCIVGGIPCATGYACDAELPASNPVSGDVLFTKGPRGIAGLCMKTCASDADCAAVNAYCDPSGGVGNVCHAGAR